MAYKITIRFVSDNLALLSNIKDKTKSNIELFIKGAPVRKGSKFLVNENMLIIYKNSMDVIDEKLIMNEIGRFEVEDPRIRKELVISNVTDNDQFGFQFSSSFIEYLGDKKFSLQISGVFIWYR